MSFGVFWSPKKLQKIQHENLEPLFVDERRLAFKRFKSQMRSFLGPDTGASLPRCGCASSQLRMCLAPDADVSCPAFVNKYRHIILNDKFLIIDCTLILHQQNNQNFLTQVKTHLSRDSLSPMKSCQISVKRSVVSVSGKALGVCCRMAVWQLNRRNHRLFSVEQRNRRYVANYKRFW